MSETVSFNKQGEWNLGQPIKEMDVEAGTVSSGAGSEDEGQKLTHASIHMPPSDSASRPAVSPRPKFNLSSLRGKTATTPKAPSEEKAPESKSASTPKPATSKDSSGRTSTKATTKKSTTTRASKAKVEPAPTKMESKTEPTPASEKVESKAESVPVPAKVETKAETKAEPTLAPVKVESKSEPIPVKVEPSTPMSETVDTAESSRSEQKSLHLEQIGLAKDKSEETVTEKVGGLKSMKLEKTVATNKEVVEASATTTEEQHTVPKSDGSVFSVVALSEFVSKSGISEGDLKVWIAKIAQSFYKHPTAVFSNATNPELKAYSLTYPTGSAKRKRLVYVTLGIGDSITSCGFDDVGMTVTDMSRKIKVLGSCATIDKMPVVNSSQKSRKAIVL